MEKRSIDYTSIPKYIPTTYVQKLFSQNKEIALMDKYDSTGTKIIDIEAATDGYN